MNSPRSGFRRTAVATWTLAGIGVAGVAGVSELAYADTLKPAEPPAAVQSEAVSPVPPVQPAGTAPAIAPDQAPAPVVAPPAPAPTAAPATPYQPQYTAPPVYTQTYVVPPAPAYVPPAPAYVPPAPAYVPPAPAYVAPPAPAPAPAPSGGGFTVRQSHTPLGGGSLSGSGNKFAPSHTASRGS